MLRQASSSVLRASCRSRRNTFAAAAKAAAAAARIDSISTGTIDSILGAFEKKNDEEDDKNKSKMVLVQVPQQLQLHSQKHHYQTIRNYSATPRQEMFLYATMILVAGVSYVGYRKYRGEPLKPPGATEAQENFRKMEEERLRASQKHVQKMNALRKTAMTRKDD
jgi:hypothetical protein